MPRDNVPNSKKPTKQGKVNESKNNHNESKEKQGNQEVIECKSISEAEGKVLELLNQGRPYNELLKIQFKIGDRIKRFNPSQIAKIRKKADFISKQFNNSNNISESINPVTIIFKLLKKGRSLTDIVIQTGIEPDIVNAAFKQYLEFENYVLCPKQIYHKMQSLVLEDCRKHGTNYSPSQIGFKDIWSFLDGVYLQNEDLEKSKLIFKCSNCKKWTNPDEEDSTDAAVYLSLHNVCHNCMA